LTARPPADVLLLGFGPKRHALAGKIFLLGPRAAFAETPAEALPIVRKGAVAAALVSCEPAFKPDAPALRELRSAAPVAPLPLVVCGPRPDAAALDAFRRAGAAFALFEPFSHGELRFVINRACHRLESEERSEVRVPTDLVGSSESGTGRKPVSVYNVSLGGAFLETLRPTAVGGRLTLEIPLPSRTLRLKARVVSTNVPGNLQRPNLPMGMGVQFLDLRPEDARALAAYVEERSRAYRLREGPRDGHGHGPGRRRGQPGRARGPRRRPPRPPHRGAGARRGDVAEERRRLRRRARRAARRARSRPS
jgi:hypothetical protein